ncbi:MAG: Gfo/Idh/MocA family oxidoreductase [Chlorobiales bacterium]|nr:Gfo/Idh/MocA family oxidoreductase [Chlorobiales bacterium]
MSEPKRALVIGAGDRGTTYASYALKHPERLRIVAVAEPNERRRERFALEHSLEPENVFNSWEEMRDVQLSAEGAIIATQDAMHVDPAVMCLQKGYDVLLEKPMALTESDCLKLIDVSREYGKSLNVCHVLRYTDFFTKVKTVVSEGIIGDIISVYHSENVSYHHMAHSFVRGNWGNSRTSSPMILAKCCHDLDLIAWIVGDLPVRISSFGTLHHFKPELAPEGSTERCTEGCPEAGKCQYDAVDTYLHGKHMKLGIAKADVWLFSRLARLMLRYPRIMGTIPGLSQYRVWKHWPTSAITEDFSRDGIMDALRKGPYGRCVYHCENDQVDHQETLIEFSNGATAILNMHGHSESEGRTLRINGSLGTLHGKFGGGGDLEVHLHGNGHKIRYPIKTDLFGHSEGDYKIMENFVRVLTGERGKTTASEALMSHQLAFAAHEARVSGDVVRFDQSRQEV